MCIRDRVYSGISIIFDNPIMVHYIHRTMAYLLFVLVIVWFTKSRRIAKAEGSSLLNKASFWTIVLISLQVLLGIITVPVSYTHLDVYKRQDFGCGELKPIRFDGGVVASAASRPKTRNTKPKK